MAQESDLLLRCEMRGIPVDELLTKQDEPVDLSWHSAAKRYLERLGHAEWVAQGQPVPRGKRGKQRYIPTDYHRDLIACLDRNDEHGFKSLKLEQGYASALGV